MQLEDGLYERLVQKLEEDFLSTANSRIAPVEDLLHRKKMLMQAFEREMKAQIDRADSLESLDLLASNLAKSLGIEFSTTESGALRELLWVSQNSTHDKNRFDNFRPITPVSELALFTNAKEEPRIDLELERELATSDRVEIIVSFIKVSGLRLLESQLMKLRDRGIPVRLITTTYMGATDKKAIDRLVNDLGVSVRIDLLPVANRLHAKAWLFHRKSGFSTAYIGSSNMSHSALTTGSEWNVRLSQVKSPDLFFKFEATFETYWESENYRQYSTEEYGEALEEALARQSKQNISDSYLLPSLDVIARPHQIKMLDEIEVARSIFGYTRNLVVAATGTGKTVLAALDYKRLIKAGQPRPSLLFVAHRQEILRQALATFRQVLGDNSFGELLVDGERPRDWRFVFASIQSLKGEHFDSLGSDHFEHLIVDEFHHAEAPSYRKLFEKFDPKQIIGLTATPERTDGVDAIWREVFGGRIATELRLWDALAQDLLAPFHYFGIGEEIDYTKLTWVAGKYEAKELNNLITTNSFRNRKVLRELTNKLPDITRMKALVFCVSVEHANLLAKEFSDLGIRTKAVTGTTENRGQIIQELRSGPLQAIATVDVFNEGVDIPEVDTIVLLRPTESPVVFLQQIGRGLRRAPGKDQVLILDFIGAHRAEYRIDTKFSALSGKPRSEVMRNLEEGFPYLPSGSAIQLDELSRDHILALMKKQIAPNWQKLVEEIKAEEITNLQAYLVASRRDLFEIYRGSGKTWLRACVDAGLVDIKIDPIDEALLRTIPRLLHIDDDVRLSGFLKFLMQGSQPWSTMGESDRRLASLFFWNLFDDGKNPLDGSEWKSLDQAFEQLRDSEPFKWEIQNLFEALRQRIRINCLQFDLVAGQHPFLLHATYSRAELLGGLGYARLPGSSIYEVEPRRAVKGAVTGVYYIPEASLDLFFVNLHKADSVSDSIRYQDYAISPTLFHWDSQNATSIESPTGQRYITQRGSGRDVLIAVREKASGPNGTMHFKLFGTADYVKHEGSNPISIWWQLRSPIDPDSFEMAAAAKVS